MKFNEMQWLYPVFDGEEAAQDRQRLGPLLEAIEKQAATGSFMPGIMDGLLTALVTELRAASTGQALEHGVNELKGTLQQLDLKAAEVRYLKTGTYDLAPNQFSISRIVTMQTERPVRSMGGIVRLPKHLVFLAPDQQEMVDAVAAELRGPLSELFNKQNALERMKALVADGEAELRGQHPYYELHIFPNPPHPGYGPLAIEQPAATLPAPEIFPQSSRFNSVSSNAVRERGQVSGWTPTAFAAGSDEASPPPIAPHPAEMQSAPEWQRPRLRGGFLNRLGNNSVAEGTAGLRADDVHKTPLGIGLVMGLSAAIGGALFTGLMVLWAGLSANPFALIFWFTAFPFVVVGVVVWGLIVGAFLCNWIVRKVKAEMGAEALPHDHPVRVEANQMARAIGLSPPPEICSFPSAEINGFAIGRATKSSCVALSQGAIEQLPPGEMRALLAHEFGHIASGDMVRMIYAQGFQRSLVFWLIVSPIQRVGRWLFSTLGEMMVLGLSRAREYRADAFGAAIAGKANMIALLNRLANDTPQPAKRSSCPELMFSNVSGGLLSTHPSFGHRIHALYEEKYIWPLNLRG